MSNGQRRGDYGHMAVSGRYKWVALSNTTLGVLMATINMSIVIIALPDIFRGLDINPLEPGNIGYLLWIIMGYILVQAVLVVTLGRLGDIFGRVRIYNAGFAVFTIGSIATALDPLLHGPGALWLILWRLLQGVGGAMLSANSTAILTDAFPAHRRGMALGINSVAGIGGSFLGFIIGGVLAPVHWRLVFFVSVPIGLIGTVWAYKSLREIGRRVKARIDWWGNLLFAVGLTAVLIAITYGIQPYGGHAEGWTNPMVLGALGGGLVVLAVFCLVETRVAQPMFHLGLYRIRAFWTGNLASLLSAVGRGGLQFMLIIWLQGIWLPLHGYNFVETPLWAAIYMIPTTVGFLLSGPVSGALSDRLGARTLATGGLLLTAATFGGLLAIPTDFTYWQFGLLLFLAGVGSGLFSAPNTTAIMNSVPADQRGQANGMRTTLMNSGMALSIGIFFSLMTTGLAAKLPHSLYAGLTGQGVPAGVAHQVASLPPIGTLFAAFLGYNPIGNLLGGHVLGQLPTAAAHTLTGKQFFPQLISDPFHHGLVIAFTAAAAMSVAGAIASAVRGGIYHHDDTSTDGAAGTSPGLAGAGTMTTTTMAPATASSEPASANGVPATGNGASRPPANGQRIPASSNGGVAHAPAGVPASGQATAVLGEESAPPEPVGGWNLVAAGVEEDAAASAADAAIPAITGRVSRHDGTAVTRAAVTLTDLHGHHIDHGRPGGDGAYRLISPAPGTYLVICASGGYQPSAARVTVPTTGVACHDIALAGATTLHGVVRRAGGTDGVDEAVVTLTGTDGTVAAATTTGADGGYRIGDLCEGRYTLTTSATGHRPTATQVVVGGDTDVAADIDLTGECRLTGTVAAASTGAPIDGALVTLTDAGGAVATVTTTTGGDGRYVFTDLAEGSYTLTATGYPPAAVPVRLVAGEAGTGDITLQPPEPPPSP